MKAAVKFFYENAGYSYNSAIETPEEGKLKSAENLAAAEENAQEAGFCFEWTESYEDSSSFTGKKKNAWTLYDCVCKDSSGIVLSSLGAIDFGKNATGPYGTYRRVVEAELSLEALN